MVFTAKSLRTAEWLKYLGRRTGRAVTGLIPDFQIFRIISLSPLLRRQHHAHGYTVALTTYLSPITYLFGS